MINLQKANDLTINLHVQNYVLSMVFLLTYTAGRLFPSDLLKNTFSITFKMKILLH